MVKAPSNHGKSGVLSLLIEKLLNSSSFELIYPESKEEIGGFIIGKLGALTIGVITFGDPGCECSFDSCLNLCVERDCEIVIAASRTKGEIYNRLCKFGNDQNAEILETSPIFINNYEASGLDAEPINEITVSMLLSLLNK